MRSPKLMSRRMLEHGVLGTARSAAFWTVEGRLAAAHNLIKDKEGVDVLVVRGGDGSLTGTDIFRAEWPKLVAELHAGCTFSLLWWTVS